MGTTSAPSVGPTLQPPPIRDAESVIERIAESCAWRASVHGLAAERWRWSGHLLGYPAALISALTGVAAFSTMPYARELTGILALAVAALGASNAYFKPKEIASEHEQAQRAFHGLSDEIGQWMTGPRRKRTDPSADADKAREQLRDWAADLARRFVELEERSPNPPSWAEQRLQLESEA